MSVMGADLAALVDPAVAFRRALGGAEEPWQARVLRSVHRRVLLLCSRQVGKSTTCAVLAAWTAIYVPGSLVLCVSPSQRQSNELLFKVKTVHRALGRPVAITGDSEGELRLENGSRVVSLPGTEGTTRGFSDVSLLLLDEASRIPDATYVGVLPMVGLAGRVVALSTPGPRQGWFFEACTDADVDRPGTSWQKHTVTCEESAQYPPERIADIRRSLSARAFAAEYLCEFSGLDDGVFDPDAVSRALVPARAMDLAGRLLIGAK